MQVVRVREMGVVRGVGVLARFRMGDGFEMVLGRVLVMLGGVLMMVGDRVMGVHVRLRRQTEFPARVGTNARA